MISSTGLARIITLLDSELTAIAVGTGATPSYTAQQLTNETFRKVVSNTFTDGLTLVKELYLDTTEANGTLTEWGIFGQGATGTAGSGKLFASTGANIVKNNTQSLTLSIEIDVLEVS